MIENFNEVNQPSQQDDLIELKEYLLHFADKWYWFVASGLLCLALSYTYYLYQKPVYQVEASLVISKERNNNTIANFFDENGWGRNPKIDNQIGILKSYTLNRQVMEKLNWRVSWYKADLFSDIGLYKAEPFTVLETPMAKNASGVPIQIEVESDKTFTLTIDKSVKINDRKLGKTFSKQGIFGKAFTSPWFNFTLDKNGLLKPEIGHKYLFIFNDNNSLIERYRKNLDINQSTKESQILILKLSGNEDARDRDYLNELIKVYIQYGLTEKNKSSENTIRFIDQQLSGTGDSLRRSAQKFSDFRSSNKIFDLSQEGTLALDKMAELESEKSIAVMRLNYYRNLYTYIGNSEQMKQLAAPSVVGITDPLFNSLVINLVELYRKREVLSYSAGELSPNIEILDKEIRLTQKTLNENIKNLLLNAETDVKRLNDQLTTINKEVAQLPGKEQQMITIKGRLDINNKMYNFLLEKKAEAAINMASNSADAYILDAAYPETTLRLGPKLILYLSIGLLLGLILPMLIILIYDFFNDRIRSLDQLTSRTSLPILGVISHNNFKSDHPVKDHPKSALSESFRGIRTNLQFMNLDGDKKVIAMHSVIPGEGKSFTSLNLAIITALNNKKVLLVGADMRKPRLDKLFDLNQGKGLSNYLIEQFSFEEIVKPTDVKGLFIAPAGSIPPNPAELLESERFDKFLELARAHFDVIIIDNAPFSIITDAIIVGSKADINIVVLRQDYSHKNTIDLVNDTAKQESIKNIGIVLNDVQSSGYKYGKSYGKYGYSYKYGGNYYSDTPRLSFMKRFFNITK